MKKNISFCSFSSVFDHANACEACVCWSKYTTNICYVNISFFFCPNLHSTPHCLAEFMALFQHIIVVYFDQQTHASHAFAWSKTLENEQKLTFFFMRPSWILAKGAWVLCAPLISIPLQPTFRSHSQKLVEGSFSNFFSRFSSCVYVSFSCASRVSFALFLYLLFI